MFTVLVAVEDATGQMEAGWEAEADLIFLRPYDILRNDKGAVKLPTIRWTCGDAGQPVYTILSASTVVGSVSIVKDYTRPGSFRLAHKDVMLTPSKASAASSQQQQCSQHCYMYSRSGKA